MILYRNSFSVVKIYIQIVCFCWKIPTKLNCLKNRFTTNTAKNMDTEKFCKMSAEMLKEYSDIVGKYAQYKQNIVVIVMDKNKESSVKLDGIIDAILATESKNTITDNGELKKTLDETMSKASGMDMETMQHITKWMGKMLTPPQEWNALVKDIRQVLQRDKSDDDKIRSIRILLL